MQAWSGIGMAAATSDDPSPANPCVWFLLHRHQFVFFLELYGGSIGVISILHENIAELDADFTVEKAKVEAMKARLSVWLLEHGAAWLPSAVSRSRLQRPINHATEERTSLARRPAKPRTREKNGAVALC